MVKNVSTFLIMSKNCNFYESFKFEYFLNPFLYVMTDILSFVLGNFSGRC